jgi:hypothetical protein
MTKLLNDLIRTLEKNEIPQGREYLRHHLSRGMCCLGVACQLHDPDAWVNPDNHPIDELSGDIYGLPSYVDPNSPDPDTDFEDFIHYPPDDVMRALGLRDALEPVNASNGNTRSDWRPAKPLPTKLLDELADICKSSRFAAAFNPLIPNNDRAHDPKRPGLAALNDRGVPFPVIAKIFRVLRDRQNRIDRRKRAAA